MSKPLDMNLAARLRASMGADVKGSLTPQGPEPPPPPQEEEQIPDIQELIDKPVDRLKLLRLVQQHAELGAQEREAKAAKKPLTAQIKKIMGAYKVGKAQMGEFRLNYFNAPRTRLDELELMRNGVSAGVIAKSKVTKDSYTLKVTRNGDEGGYEEGEE